MNDAATRPRRILLAVLLATLALNAFGGGLYGMMGAPGVPLEWLAGTPFRNYFVPSLILFAVVGGSSLLAAVSMLVAAPFAPTAALAAGIITLGWIAVQVWIIGYVSWLQPAVALTGLAILGLAGSLKKDR